MRPASVTGAFMLVTGAFMQAAGPAQAAGFAASGASIKDGAAIRLPQVLDRHGCGGGNRSPALSWSAPPPATRSLAVTLFDRDARAGAGFWHWALVDLPPSTRKLAEDAGHAGRLAKGAVELRDDFDLVGYGGPCPPPGDPPHHYELSVWALDVARLPRDTATTAAAAAPFIKSHSLVRATITASYGR